VMRSKTSQAIDILVITMSVLLLFHRYFTDPSANIQGDWGVVSRASALEYLREPWLWNTIGNEGGYFLELYRFPILYIHALGMLLTGWDYSVLTILVYPFPIIAAISCYVLCTFLNIGRLSRLVCSIAYSISPTVFLRLQAGHLPMLMAYSIYPICLAFLIKGLRGESTLMSIQYGFACGISIAICSFYELRIASLILLLMTFVWGAILASDMRLIVTKRTAPLRHHVFFICAACIAFSSMSWFYLVPFIRDLPALPPYLATSRWLPLLSLSPLLLTMSSFNSYFVAKYDALSIVAIAVLAGLAYFAAILRPREKMSCFLLFGFLTAAFLSKGTNPPVGFVNFWIYGNIPLLSTIREPLRFMVIGQSFFCLLLGFSIDSTLEIIRFRQRANQLTKRRGKQLLLTFLVLFLIFVQVAPALDGRINVYGSNCDPSYADKLEGLATADGRIAWIPFSSRYYLKDQIDWNQLLWQSPRATALVAQVQSFPSQYSKAVLSLLGVAYVALPPRTDPSMVPFGERQRYVNTIKSIGGVRLATDPIEVYLTSTRVPFFYSPDSTVLVVGSPKVGVKLLSSVPPGRVGFFFLDQIPENIDEILEICDSVIFESEGGIYDIVMRKLSLTYGIDLEYADQRTGKAWTLVDLATNANGSWRNVFPSNFAKILRGDPGAELDVSFRVNCQDRFSMWVRGLCSPYAGKVNVCIDDKLKFEASFRTRNDGPYKWTRIGSLEICEGAHKVTINSQSGNNYLDPCLLMVPENVLEQTIFEVRSKLKSKSCLLADEFIRSCETHPFSMCQFVETKPHTFAVVLPKQARVLVSSLVHDPRWSISDQVRSKRSIICQGMVNAFVVLDLSRSTSVFYEGEAELSALWARFSFLLVLVPFFPIALAVLRRWRSRKTYVCTTLR